MWSHSSRCLFQNLKGCLDFCRHQFPALNQEVLVGHIFPTVGLAVCVELRYMTDALMLGEWFE